MNQFSIRAAAKAYLAALGAAIAYLVGVLDPTAIGLEAFGDVTTTQWLGLITTVLSSFGITWAVPNQDVP